MRRYRQIVAGILAFAGVVLTSLVAIWLLSADARREIDRLAVANADSTQWTLAQFEVEFLSYQHALLQAMEGRADLNYVRRRFDVFYSRAQIVKSAQSFNDVIAIPEIKTAVSRVDDLLSASVPDIDGNDERLQGALAGLYEQASDIRPDVRAISLAGVNVFAGRSEIQRSNVAQALTDLGEIALLLLVGLLVVVAVLMLMMRSSHRQTAKIALTQGRLQSIISTSLDAILVVDRTGRILDYNGAAEGIFGYSRDEAIGAEMGALIVPDHMRAAHDAGMHRFRETGVKHVVGSGLLQLEAKRKDGTVFPVELSINGAESDDGEIFVSFLRDISQRVESETELVEARDKAVAGEKAKADLLAVMSHEMRTPLNGVLGTLQLLAHTDLDQRQRNFVDVMGTSGQTLLEHVNNVLDISRIDAGKAMPVTQVFDLPHLVKSVVDSLGSQADARGNTLSVTSLGDLEERVSGDMPRLRQVMFNLLGNAIKFTENGSITVEIEREGVSDDVEFRIIDTGIGIAEADVGRIFDDFVTLDASYQREVEGTGLGLGIVKRMVEMLGGELGVESELGEGSVFWFRVPLPVARKSTSRIPEGAAQPDLLVSPRSVLVVEDNEINRMVVREMLLQLGCDVVESHDGKEGVAAAGKQKFDVILMDVSMPRMDGTTATEIIRSGDGPNKATPIIALTAHALPDDIERFRKIGMSDVVTKPISRDRLIAVVSNVKAEVPKTTGQNAREELEAVLGPDKANDFVEKARNELSEGLEKLVELFQNPATRGEVSEFAHKLSGTAALVGFEAIHTELKRIEMNSDRMSREELAEAVEASVAELGVNSQP